MTRIERERLLEAALGSRPVVLRPAANHREGDVCVGEAFIKRQDCVDCRVAFRETFGDRELVVE